MPFIPDTGFDLQPCEYHLRCPKFLSPHLFSINRFSKDLSWVFSLQKIKGFPEDDVEWLQLQVHHMLFNLHLISQEERKYKI